MIQKKTIIPRPVFLFPFSFSLFLLLASVQGEGRRGVPRCGGWFSFSFLSFSFAFLFF